MGEPSSGQGITLVFLQSRINLSPFTKDFRGGEHRRSLRRNFLSLFFGWGDLQIKGKTCFCSENACLSLRGNSYLFFRFFFFVFCFCQPEKQMHLCVRVCAYAANFSDVFPRYNKFDLVRSTHSPLKWLTFDKKMNFCSQHIL